METDLGPEQPPLVITDATLLAQGGAHWKIRQGYAYWKSIHPAGGLPGRQHLEPLAIPDLLRHVWLADLALDPFQVRYRLAGTGVVAGLGREVRGLPFHEAHPGAAAETFYRRRIMAMIETRAATWRRGESKLWEHEVWLNVENLILPMAADGQRIDMLLGVSLFFDGHGAELH
jgi:hypothetical protein